VLALQRSVGNRAVRQVLQRAPTGLKESKPTTDFTNDALAYWRDPANQSKGLGEYAMVLAKKANALLKSIGVPEVKPVIDTKGQYDGLFDGRDWKMRMNIARWSRSLGTKASKLGDLTMEEAANAAGAIYHEARHAEQRFRVARMMAGQSKGKTVDQIADEIQKTLEIAERPVALTAAGAPLADTAANAGLIGEARDWEAITVGFNVPYRKVVNNWLDEVMALQDALTDLGQHPMKVMGAKGTFKQTIDDWRKSASRAKFPATHLKGLKARRPAAPGDALVTTNLKAIATEWKKLDAAWKKIERSWDKDSNNTRLQNLIAFKTPLYELYKALYDAYKTQAHEADAWETGDTVAAQFKAGAPAKPPAKVPAGAAP